MGGLPATGWQAAGVPGPGRWPGWPGRAPSPPAAVQSLRAGEVDVIWGGPLRVMTLHDTEPGVDLVCFCDVVARDPFFVIGPRPRPDFKLADLAGLRFATVSEVPTPCCA